MARGKTSAVGDTRVAKNGYHYTKVAERGWVLTHWLTMEKKIGRLLTADESVRFLEPKFKRDPYNVDGLVLIKKRQTSLRRRKAQLEARIEELQAELHIVNGELNA